MPKTFENFDFGRMQGRDSAALESISSMSSLYARKNIAFIGPGGIGKTHLAQAFGRKCCLLGYKTYYLKATELKEKLAKAARAGTAARAVTSLVRPACLIIDEIGRCSFDKECTDLFFDVIDRRYEKEGPNTLIVTSNAPVCNWAEVLRRRRHAAVHAGPRVRPGVGLHDEGSQLPRGRARDVLRRGRP